MATDAYSPIKGKCNWWREEADEQDSHDPTLKDAQRKVNCSCFVEGDRWSFAASEVPKDCPTSRSCRYYIKNS